MSENMEEKLIEAVRERKLLYDTSHSDYVKSKLKSQVWNEIANETGMKNGKLISLSCVSYFRSFHPRHQNKVKTNSLYSVFVVLTVFKCIV